MAPGADNFDTAISSIVIVIDIRYLSLFIQQIFIFIFLKVFVYLVFLFL